VFSDDYVPKVAVVEVRISIRHCQDSEAPKVMAARKEVKVSGRSLTGFALLRLPV
jgi:hypothetical protein